MIQWSIEGEKGTFVRTVHFGCQAYMHFTLNVVIFITWVDISSFKDGKNKTPNSRVVKWFMKIIRQMRVVILTCPFMIKWWSFCQTVAFTFFPLNPFYKLASRSPYTSVVFFSVYFTGFSSTSSVMLDFLKHSPLILSTCTPSIVTSQPWIPSNFDYP